MNPKNRIIRRLEIGVWVAAVILFAVLYLRLFTPLGGTFPERTRGPAAFWKSEYYELGELPEDEKKVLDALPTERIHQ